MRIPGERIKRTRLIQTDKYVVAVEVEMVIPVDDPSEPCYESETVQFLREVRHGRRAWLLPTVPCGAIENRPDRTQLVARQILQGFDDAGQMGVDGGIVGANCCAFR